MASLMARLIRVDRWLARNLFHPPLIRLCQALDVNQWWLCRVLRMIGGTLITVYFWLELSAWVALLLTFTVELITVMYWVAFLVPRLRGALSAPPTQTISEEQSTYANLRDVLIHLILVALWVWSGGTLIWAVVGTHLAVWATYAYDILNIPPPEQKRKLAWSTQ